MPVRCALCHGPRVPHCHAMCSVQSCTLLRQHSLIGRGLRRSRVFHDIPESIRREMEDLEKRDAIDRIDGTAMLDRLRQIPPETGQILALLAASAPAGGWVEIGTSAGYSALWLALACRERGQTLTTFEILAAKSAMAAQIIVAAGVTDVITLVEGDFLDHVDRLGDIGFCFLDAEKEVYRSCYEAVVPRMVPGALLVADNAMSRQADLQPMLDAALSDPRVDALVIPIGTGELVCRKR